MKKNTRNAKSKKNIKKHKKNVKLQKYNSNNTRKKYKKHNKNSRKRSISNGGTTIYDGTKLIHSDLTYNGKPFFRKMFYYSNPPTEIQKQIVFTENEIVKILIQNPHPNIVTYFDINNKYVDMEELNTKDINPEEVKIPMENVKNFLQSLGIMYIDWKIDNIGKDKNGIYKLFDFDASGLIDLHTNKWKITPPNYWSFRKAKENNCNTPQEIDNWSFEYNILGNENITCNKGL